MQDKPKPVDPCAVLDSALKTKFNYLVAEGIFEQDEDYKAKADIEDKFDALMAEDPCQYGILWMKGLVNDDWYTEFQRLHTLNDTWQQAAYDYANQTTGGDLTVYDLLNLDETFGTGVNPHTLIEEIITSAQDSGLTTLLTREQTAKLLDDCFGRGFPVTPDQF